MRPRLSLEPSAVLSVKSEAVVTCTYNEAKLEVLGVRRWSVKWSMMSSASLLEESFEQKAMSLTTTRGRRFEESVSLGPFEGNVVCSRGSGRSVLTVSSSESFKSRWQCSIVIVDEEEGSEEKRTKNVSLTSNREALRIVQPGEIYQLSVIAPSVCFEQPCKSRRIWAWMLCVHTD